MNPIAELQRVDWNNPGTLSAAARAVALTSTVPHRPVRSQNPPAQSASVLHSVEPGSGKERVVEPQPTNVMEQTSVPNAAAYPARLPSNATQRKWHGDRHGLLQHDGGSKQRLDQLVQLRRSRRRRRRLRLSEIDRA